MASTNREYKDRLFKFIFGNPDNKDFTLSLYNAVNGSHYTDPSLIQLNIIENAVYMSMKNDVSFLVDNTMSFYEQQSTFNPNMPMRFFIYASMLYSKYIKTSGKYYKYSSKLQKLPTPKCVCFYNGKTEKDDRTIFRLSDAFEGGSDPDIEVTVTMININYGHNQELFDECKPLQSYAWFVEKVREHQEQTGDLSVAVDLALEEMPDESVIKSFLIANKAEVKMMCITEYDEERTLLEQREEGRTEGRAEGRVEGRAEGIMEALVGLVKDGILSLSDAAKRANMTVSEFEEQSKQKI